MPQTKPMITESQTPSDERSFHQRLQGHAKHLQGSTVNDLFEDAERAADFCLDAAGLHLDFSKQLIDPQTLQTLIELAQHSKMTAMRDGLFSDAPINSTEQRSALHTLLRASRKPDSDTLSDKYKLAQKSLNKISAFVDAIYAGTITGYSGKAITDVVNIGIGGSDLGPKLAWGALRAFRMGDVNSHFIANIDPVNVSQTLAPLKPESTLFIVCSKSFVSAETLKNAELGLQWLQSAASGADISKQLIAVTANADAAVKFGVNADHIVPIWDWVGGRYSLWSGVGLSIAIAVGMKNFRALLKGAESMDKHFHDVPWHQNMPAIMALLEHWSVNYLGCQAHAVIPYAQTLHLLPAYLQQLSMESNGKSVDIDGNQVNSLTAPILWGDIGTNGQHSFHQLLHQGTITCPVDFILPLSNPGQNVDQQAHLVANCIAQSQALMLGRDLQSATRSLLDRGMTKQQAEQLAPHLVIPGNRPNSTITMKQLTPETLGALLALYEHKTACCAALWNINPFDQWGVELGKELSVDILAALEDDALQLNVDSSTQKLIDAFRKSK
ncbi:glucose-6-phosphate isomerase [Halieaceae bacterium]|nr:glucose-6-phosphate isomerase [Halieaceae bacterium]